VTDFDVITLGRVSMDLYAQEIGADITEVSGFDAMVGGSPSNIAIGSARLGNRVAAITAVGNDEVGRFVTAHLAREGVDTRWVPTKAQGRTGLAILGVQPPDHFPLTFYRDNPADVYLTVADVLAAPITRTHALVLSGTALSRGTCKEATYAAAEAARDAGVRVFLDLDLRPDQWSDGAGYGAAIRRLLPLVDVAIGTEE
jgi:5-dehydro-2-deoxygluconokinase